MIKKIFIQNYKIFEQFDLELNSDLNIIVGDNEVGKSTILEELCQSNLEMSYSWQNRNVLSYELLP